VLGRSYFLTWLQHGAAQRDQHGIYIQAYIKEGPSCPHLQQHVVPATCLLLCQQE
jgi:hypothetical protein